MMTDTFTLPRTETILWAVITGFVKKRGLRCLRTAVIAFCITIIGGCGISSNPEEASAVAMVRRLGGKLEFEGAGPDQHVSKIYLNGSAVQNEDLAELPNVKKLRTLFLGKTQISDAGLAYMASLKELKILSLNSTKISDSGLKSLTKLTSLKTINLQETSVTTGGVAGLRKALPGVQVAR